MEGVMKKIMKHEVGYAALRPMCEAAVRKAHWTTRELIELRGVSEASTLRILRLWRDLDFVQHKKGEYVFRPEFVEFAQTVYAE